MKSFTLPIIDSEYPNVLDAICSKYGYQQQVTSENDSTLVDNPLTQHQFVEDILRDWLLQETMSVLAVRAQSDALNRFEQEAGTRLQKAMEFFNANRVGAVESPEPTK